ncbi:MFS transporter [Streptomyces tateyamensis]|uniref:MFS transporter n=1 Tax=Streptomyces tateyamensis TaxID=565073 RepID=A0A2V4NFA7_9ACTN|nr:MFS transporter [Streptomyces tateyamensis]PYC83779.1 MFS transporter [Streptomyces tateyamensis]
MTQALPAASAPPDVAAPRVAPDFLIVALACLGQFLVVLDAAVVNVALPSTGAALHFSATGLPWVVNGYAVTVAGLLLLGGRAVDVFGRRRIFLLGLATFTLASLACGLAVSPGMLVAARFVQGAGAAAIGPSSLTILTTTLPAGPRRTKALGTWSAVGAAGGAVGNVLGGVLTSALSWRYVFLINLPIGAGLILLASVYLTDQRSEQKQRLDVLSVLTVTGGLSLLEFGVIQTRAHGWTGAAALVPMALGALAIAAFLTVQARTTGTPLLPLRLLRSRTVAAVNLTVLGTGAAFFSMWYFMSLYVQGVLGYGPLSAGLAFVPHTVTVVLSARLLTPRLLAVLPARTVVVAGTLISAAGFLWQSTLTPHSGYLTGVVGPGLLITLGMGMSFTPLASIATTGVATSQAGLVSGLLNTSRQIGGSVGLAALVTLASAASLSWAGGNGAAAATGQGLTAGYHLVFLGSATVLVAAALLAQFGLPAGEPPARGGKST